MILKKPYAFLIKYFKLIHLLLCVLLGFIVFKYTSLLNFFVSYINNNYMVSNTYNLSGKYIPSIFIIAIIVSIALFVTITVLLRHKKKPFTFYVIAIVYYLILLIFLAYLSGVLSSFNQTLLASTSARAIRDILLIYSLFQYAFIIVCVVRFIGFDIKKFNFADDIKDLGLSASDAEEFELNINFDGYAAKRKTRKIFRELGYYIRENLFIFICIIIAIIIITIISVYKNTHSNYDRSFKEGNSFIYENIEYSVNNSIITNVDYSGQNIKADKYYLVLNVSANNKSKNLLKVNREMFKLQLGKKLISPDATISNRFLDFCFSENVVNIASMQAKTFAIVYEINEEDIKSSYKIVLYNGVVYDKGEYINRVINIKLSPENHTIINTHNNAINEHIILNGTSFGNSSITITGVSTHESYMYTYESCIKGTCKTYKDKLVLTTFDNDIILIANMGLTLDTESDYGKRGVTLRDFSNYFMYVRYMINGEEHIERNNITPSNANDFVAFKIKKYILEADDTYIVIRVGNEEYQIKITD